MLVDASHPAATTAQDRTGDHHYTTHPQKPLAMSHAFPEASNYTTWSADRKTDFPSQDVTLPPPSAQRPRAVLPPLVNGGKSHGQFTVRLGTQ
ncbi:hypothetical protein CGMCC3_g8862 [Colletotrichum fructicola]|nr:uncharacterized protein CGMCC3_g8862 [Colletotrichum fructicola]KAE9575144.1 hypothetical protein CGMCC3_g8862 [Colletotrichum fructicola]